VRRLLVSPSSNRVHPECVSTGLNQPHPYRLCSQSRDMASAGRLGDPCPLVIDPLGGFVAISDLFWPCDPETCLCCLKGHPTQLAGSEFGLAEPTSAATNTRQAVAVSQPKASGFERLNNACIHRLLSMPLRLRPTIVFGTSGHRSRSDNIAGGKDFINSKHLGLGGAAPCVAIYPVNEAAFDLIGRTPSPKSGGAAMIVTSP
jgi:hypothetical protein